jgi:CBS domain-containing protein
VAVTLEDEHPAVCSLIVRGPHRGEWVVAWERVRTFEPTGVILGPDGRSTMAPDELRLARDVLDVQIVDVAGKRVRRVSDVELTRTDGGLRVVAVDVGWPGLARRLGAGRLSRGRAPAHDLVDWNDLHVMSARGHGLQLRTTSAALHRLTPGELSELVADLPPQRAAEALDAVGSQRAAAAVSIVRPGLGGRLVGALPPAVAARTLEAMPVDDAVAVLRHLDHEAPSLRLAAIPQARRAELERLLLHPADTAGGLMTTDMRIAATGDTLDEILTRLRRRPPPLEGLFTVVVVDDDGRVARVVPPSSLILGRAEPVDAPVVTAGTPVERLGELFARYDLVAVPVVDAERRPLGLVAVDDVLEEALSKRLPHHPRRYPWAHRATR